MTPEDIAAAEEVSVGGITTEQALGLMTEDPVNGSVGFAYHLLLVLLANIQEGGARVYIGVDRLLDACRECALDVSFNEEEQRFYVGVIDAPPFDEHSEICAFGHTVWEADA